MSAGRLALPAILLATIACSFGTKPENVVTVVVIATQEPTKLSPTLPPAPTARPATQTPSLSALELRTQDLIASLRDEGYIDSTSGTYHAIPAFSESWAQLNWYQWWETGYTPKDFVISAHTTWESASDTANWWTSGCGFVFREQGEDDHYLVYLGMDGWVYLSRFKGGNFADLGSRAYGQVDVPKGEADVVLVVEGRKVHYFINGEHVLTRDDLQDTSGVLAFTLLSGTNKAFGTRCTMEDVALWEID